MVAEVQRRWWQGTPAVPRRKPGISFAVELAVSLALCTALWAVTRDISDGARWAFVHAGGAVCGAAMFLAEQLRSRPVVHGCVMAVGVAAMVAGYILGLSLVGHFAALIELAWSLAMCYALLGAVEIGRRSARSS